MGSLVVVAFSKTPYGPFENPVETKLGFDPGVLVDDDGKVYAYRGDCAAPCYIVELEDDMATFKEETLVSNPLGHPTCQWGLIGKHAVYFEFLSETGTQEFDRFTFN